jgi:hypothetical protein
MAFWLMEMGAHTLISRERKTGEMRYVGLVVSLRHAG